MDPVMQVLDPAIEVCLIGPPCQPVDPRGGIPLEREERRPQHRFTEMVEERGEPFLLPLPRGFSYALQRLGSLCRPLRRRTLAPLRPACRSRLSRPVGRAGPAG